MIVTAKVRDRAKFAEQYGKDTAPLVAAFGGRYVLRAPGAELSEGDFGDDAAIVICEWPDKAAARAFWESPEYGALKIRRRELAETQILLVEAPAIGA